MENAVSMKMFCGMVQAADRIMCVDTAMAKEGCLFSSSCIGI